ncbi:hypothetical protein [Pseudoalteromonas rubra]|uniref:Uncharacterized protein n=1 Tax=Pseudoalteromonas rubra TaxID=43658 RepID=A0A0U3I5B3_9GAMM|nr:hypothetical protein [Pseudoalteromonas rubra]ALU45190.1 hypothetical protein AT705_19705 [Pseudoalteromonas rubra]
MRFNLLSKKSLLACAVSLALFGCGGSNHDDKTETKQGTKDSSVVTEKDKNAVTEKAKTRTITAIDGYLVNAIVCDDQNGNQVCDAGEEIKIQNEKGEELVLTTNAQGQAEVSDSASVIVKVVAGKTIDTDTNNTVSKAYTLVAHADTDIVSPFSTLATLKNVDMDTLAAEVNLDAELIKGDFVAAKSEQTASIAEGSKRIHLVARSVVKLLPEDFSSDENVSEELVKDAVKLVELADQQSLEGIDDIVIEKNEENDTLVINPLVEQTFDLKDLLEQGDGFWYMGSTSHMLFSQEGAEQFQVKDGKLIFPQEVPTEYQIVDGAIVADSDESYMFYLSNDLLLGTDKSQGDMIFLSKQYDVTAENAAKFTVEALTSKPMYTMISEGPSQTDVYHEFMLLENIYNTDGTGKITLVGTDESFDMSWVVTQDGVLEVTFSPDGEEVTESYYRSPSDNAVFLIRAEMENTQPILATQDLALAQEILDNFAQQYQ